MVGGQSVFCCEIVALHTSFDDLLVDSMINLRRKFAHFTQGYAAWLLGQVSSGPMNLCADCDITPHFRAALAWTRGFFDTARLCVGRLAFGGLSRAAADALAEAGIALMRTLSGVTEAAGSQFRADCRALIDLVDLCGGGSDSRLRFTFLDESSRLLGLNEVHFLSLVESAELLTPEGGSADATSDAHLSSMLAAHGIYSMATKDAADILKRRRLP